MRKQYFILLLFFSLSIVSNAQIDYQQGYLKAKSFYDNGKYNLAMEAFKPLIRVEEQNDFSAYASYFYAISAYNSGYEALSRDMLLQIQELFPNWNKIEDVHLWLAKIYFETENYKKGLEYSNKIEVNYEQSRLQQLHFLNKIDSVYEIKRLFENFNNDKEVAYRYAQLIIKQPLYLQDRNLLAQLVDDYNLNEDEFLLTSKETSIKKDTYNIAVMLPFIVEKLQPNLYKKGNQFVIDVYDGALKAQKDLEQKGINIKLFAYDTEKSRAKTVALLEKQEMMGMDLFVGPLYPDPSRVASDFSLRNRINMFNPISSNQQVIGQNPFSFLYHASDATQARTAAQYVVENETNKNTMIFYGGSEKDSIKAHIFRDLIVKDSFNIVTMKKIEKDTSSYIMKLLTTTIEDVEATLEHDESLTDEERATFLISKDSIGTIYVASDDKLLASGVVSSIEIRPDTIQVIGSSDWLNYRFIDFEAYERLGIILTASNYINTNGFATRQLNNYCIARYGKPASTYFLEAYDMIMFLGNSLYKYGSQFQNELYKLPMTPSELTAGISYFQANDNQHVPLIYFKNDKISVIELKIENE